MKIKIIQIGNSQGIRLSKTIIEKYQITDQMEIKLEKDHIKLIPVATPRHGWGEAFAEMHQNNDDALLLPDVFEDENDEEWK